MPNAPFLAPERDSAFKIGRERGNSVTQYSVPGASLFGTGVSALAANTDRYGAMNVVTPIIIDRVAFEVTTGSASKNARVGIYCADTDYQPVGAPLLDSGSVDCTAAAVKTYDPGTPLFLPRGLYVQIINTDSAAPGFRYFKGALPGGGVLAAMGATPMNAMMTVSRTYAAFPTPGTAWTATFDTSDGHWYFMACRVSSP